MDGDAPGGSAEPEASADSAPTPVVPREFPWSEGSWTTPPAASAVDGTDLLVTAVEGSDAWRTTSYGFVHDTEHALLTPFSRDSAVEVEFTADFDGEFDQAGLFLRIADDRWVKAGLEFSEGSLQLGAVVTAPTSDWSLGPVPSWTGRRVTIRASWAGDAVTLRAHVDDEPSRLVRVLPFPPDAVAWAGPLVSAPSRADLTVRFHAWRVTEPDAALH
ncbi:DUF1349 domain-containing protein [Herbiconiux ginsengi]|uniref:DUF1349 domain-containing protein n=1 Tax=Herbiconiux ginsengi TaxID=381665 RepID=UPI001FDF3154|nr:DUF1349 domain-containing protein [Herbiconiux ginsengi]